MKNLIFKVILVFLLGLSAKADVVKVDPVLVESELKYQLFLNNGAYKCVALTDHEKEFLVNSLRENNIMSGYTVVKLRFFNSENLRGVVYALKISSKDREFNFDVYSDRNTCISSAEYKNGER